MGKNGKSKNIKCIAITGPSASGKSMLAERLASALGRTQCVVICQDDYYKDWPRLSKKARKKINFDDAKAFDFHLLRKHIRELKNGKPIRRPSYCFVESKRLSRRKTITPKPVVIVEGLMLLVKSELRRLSDCKVYIDVDSAVSLSRRLKRDIAERAETIESVCRRYFNEVLPMQKRYVETQKRRADVIVNGRKRITHKEISRIMERIK